MDRLQDALWEALWVVGPAVLGYLFGVLKRSMKINLYKNMMRFNVKDPSESPLKFITANTEQAIGRNSKDGCQRYYLRYIGHCVVTFPL